MVAGAQSISNNDLLELDVDVLVPAALEDQITEANANNIQARTIVEVANGPITNAADEILDQKILPWCRIFLPMAVA